MDRTSAFSTPEEKARYFQLRRYSKSTLVSMHIRKGGVMPRVTYMKWRKDELISAAMRDEGYLGW